MELTPNWEYVADRVMGGVSNGRMYHEIYNGHMASVLRGNVSLDNNGGFIQIAFDLRSDGAGFDASGWDGIAFETCGNNERYDVRFRTEKLTCPWQSFRTDFVAKSQWRSHKVPFETLEAHKTDACFDPAHLRRIGILAIGREFQADVAIAGMRLYRFA